MDIHELRQQINDIDEQLVALFVKRMEIAGKVADYKKANNLPIYVPGREQEILERVSNIAGADMAEYVQELFGFLFDLSRKYQHKRNDTEVI